MPAETIGDRLRRYRRSKGLSQRRLAELSSVSRQFIAELERNAVTIPREPDNVRALATVLGVSMQQLAGPTGWYDEDPKKDDWRALLWSDDRLDDEAKRFLERAIANEFAALEQRENATKPTPERRKAG